VDSEEDAGVEPFLQLVQCTVVRRPDVFARGNRDHVVGQRGEHDLVGLDEEKALADLDGQPLAPVPAFGDAFDDLLELLGRDARRGAGGFGRAVGGPLERDEPARALDGDVEPRGVDRLRR
jgi:hypothetical protein